MTRVTSPGRRLLQSSRPISWVNTAYPFAAAFLLASPALDVWFWLIFTVATIYFLVPYNLAMYGINDVFDYESDLRNPRKGGVEGAVLERGMHRITLWAVVITNVPFLVFLVVVGIRSAPSSVAVLTVSIFAVVAYSAKGLRFKEIPFLDSVTSSTHFVSPAVFGLALAGATFTPQLVALLVAYFLWGMASHAFGAVQDVRSDRAAGIGSVATVIGARKTVWFAAAAYLAAAALVLVTPWPGPLAAIIGLIYVVNVAPFMRITDETSEKAHRGWSHFLWLNYLAGFIVTMLLIGYALLR